MTELAPRSGQDNANNDAHRYQEYHDPEALWADPQTASRERDKREEARRLFIPGGIVMGVALVLGIGMLMIDPPPKASPTLAQQSARAVPTPYQVRTTASVPPTSTGQLPLQQQIPSPSSAAEGKHVEVLVGEAEPQGAEVQQVVAQLRKAGWVPSTPRESPFSVRMPTVYYPRGQREQAVELAAALPGMQRFVERTTEKLPSKGLVVVL